MKWMILLTKHDFIYKMLYVGNWEKKTRNEKIPRLVDLPSSFYHMEAVCCPVSKNTKSKPDLP